ncbi:putative glycogen synthesis protein [Citrobacter farmeri GTC 1319]|nr:putative glycogen synthesis protein [Citrobacter farmeri GTC 1319]
MIYQKECPVDFLAKSYISMELEHKGVSIMAFSGNMPNEMKLAFLLRVKHYKTYSEKHKS